MVAGTTSYFGSFSPGRHKYDSRKALQKGDFDGAGLEIIRKMCDDFVFLNHGKRGKEFRLVKLLPGKHVSELPPEPPHPSTTKEPKYEVVPATIKDAEHISQLIYNVYGHSYSKEDLYFPERVERAIKHKEKYGVVVKTQEDETVGYFAILKIDDSPIGEIGEAAVSLVHRRRGLMKMMIQALFDIAKAHKLKGLFGEAVTVHHISQKVNHRFDMRTTALMLAAFLPSHYKGLYETFRNRVSIIIDFIYLDPPKSVERYLPSRYKSLLREIYQQFGVEVINKRARKITIGPQTVSDVTIDYEQKHAVIIIHEYGLDFDEVVESAMKDLTRNGMKVIFLDMPLDREGVKVLVKNTREKGFIFSGLVPRFHNERDFLRLQKLNCEVDLNDIYVYSKVGKKIKRLVTKESVESGQNVVKK